MDYGALIGDALADAAGNGFRMEAAARATQALLFHESARACHAAHAQGFPLTLESRGETFSLLLEGESPRPFFEFSRAGDVLYVREHFVAAAAIDDRRVLGGWLPGELPAEMARAKVEERIELAVRALAQHVKLRRRRP